MRLLADENIPNETIKRVTDLGHEIVSARDLLGPERPDIDIFHFAQENGFVILTRDKDFADLAHRYRDSHNGVILIRLEIETQKRITAAVVSFFGTDFGPLPDTMIVLEMTRIRVYRR